MNIRRVVPDIRSKQMDESRAFYVDFLGFNVGMDMDFITTFVSPSNPTSQISVLHDDGSSALLPNVSIEVEDVDKVYADATTTDAIIAARQADAAASAWPAQVTGPG